MKINQTYGDLSWTDAYPMSMFALALDIEGKLKHSSQTFNLGVLQTSHSGWRDHKSCYHEKWDATVDFGLQGPSNNITTGIQSINGYNVLFDGDATVIKHLQDPVDDYWFAGDLSYAVRARTINVHKGVRGVTVIRLERRQFIRNEVFWYPVWLATFKVYAKGNGHIYDYQCQTYAEQNWSHTDRYVRSDTLEQSIFWTTDLDELTRKYFYNDSQSYSILFRSEDSRIAATTLQYAGSHRPEIGKSFSLPYRSFSMTKDQLRRYMDESIRPLFGRWTIPTISDWGDLCQEAIQKGEIQANAWTLWHDLRAVGSEIVSYGKAIKKPSLKNISGAYLNTRYGTRLTAQDMSEYADYLLGITKKWNSVYKGYDTYVARRSVNKSGWVGYDSITCYASLKDSMTDIVVHSLQQTGVGQLANAWDIIPFTFVVDWFFEVEALFENLDYRWNACTLNVKDVIRTYKRARTLTIPNFLFCGHDVDVTLSVYHRSCGHKLSYPSLGIHSSDDYQNHVLDLTMIGLQILA